MILRLGQVVPLTLSCEKAGLRPTVQIQEISGEVLYAGELVDRGGGFYSSEAYLMPDRPMIVARYLVEGYLPAEEKFQLDQITTEILARVDESENRHDNYYQGVVIEESSDDFIEGVIDGTVEAQAS